MRGRNSRLYGGLICLAVMALCPLPAAGQGTALSPDTDGGGNSFPLPCGPTRALVGIAGGAGQWIDWVKGLCREITNDGRWIGGQTETSTSGAASGTAFSLVCPQNHAVTGTSGNAGQWLNMLQVHCRPLGAAGQVSGTAVFATTSTGATSAGTRGGIGSADFPPINCSGTIAGQGVIAVATTVPKAVNRIGLNCVNATPWRLNGLNLGVNSVVGGNTVTATVTFNRQAPAQETVTLSSSASNLASVPASLSIPQLSTQRTFSITTGTTGGCVQIRASNHGITSSRNLVVQPPPAARPLVTLSTPDQPLIIEAGTQTGTVSGPSRAMVTLTSSNPAIVRVPASVTLSATLPATAQFTMTGVGNGCAVITATYQSSSARRIVYAGSIGG